MKLQQLRYLCAVVDQGFNVTAAAQTLFTSQPGVSKQIRQLERELGVEILSKKFGIRRKNSYVSGSFPD